MHTGAPCQRASAIDTRSGTAAAAYASHAFSLPMRNVMLLCYCHMPLRHDAPFRCRLPLLPMRAAIAIFAIIFFRR